MDINLNVSDYSLNGTDYLVNSLKSWIVVIDKLLTTLKIEKVRENHIKKLISLKITGKTDNYLIAATI